MAEQRAQRRLAAILVADVVGYSRLMRTDEAGTLVELLVAAGRSDWPSWLAAPLPRCSPPISK